MAPDGLASGSVSACGAELDDAQAGGACGAVTSCVGAGCETVRAQSNTGFVDATSRLNMVMELGGEEFDREDMRFFTGDRRACTIRLFGLANCCTNSGALVGLANCSAQEAELAEERQRRQHPLSRQVLRETHLLRGVHPPGAGLVRVRLQARAHPPGAGPRAARDRLGELPRAQRGRGRVASTSTGSTSRSSRKT